jgi:hypothetical protein
MQLKASHFCYLYSFEVIYSYLQSMEFIIPMVLSDLIGFLRNAWNEHEMLVLNNNNNNSTMLAFACVCVCVILSEWLFCLFQEVVSLWACRCLTIWCSLCQCSFLNFHSMACKDYFNLLDISVSRCQICPYRSRDSSQLTVHLRTHTGIIMCVHIHLMAQPSTFQTNWNVGDYKFSLFAR